MSNHAWEKLETVGTKYKWQIAKIVKTANEVGVKELERWLVRINPAHGDHWIDLAVEKYTSATEGAIPQKTVESLAYKALSKIWNESGNPQAIFPGWSEIPKPGAYLGLPHYNALNYMAKLDRFFVSRYISESDQRTKLIADYMREQYQTQGWGTGWSKRELAAFVDRFGGTAQSLGMNAVRTIIDTGVARARVWGTLDALASRGVKTFTIGGPIDNLTCRYCAFMKGRTFSIPIEQIRVNDMISSGSEDRRAFEPFFVNRYGGNTGYAKLLSMSSGDIQNAGTTLPPFHGRCRHYIIAGSGDYGSWTPLPEYIPVPSTPPVVVAPPEEKPKKQRKPRTLKTPKTDETKTDSDSWENTLGYKIFGDNRDLVLLFNYKFNEYMKYDHEELERIWKKQASDETGNLFPTNVALRGSYGNFTGWAGSTEPPMPSLLKLNAKTWQNLGGRFVKRESRLAEFESTYDKSKTEGLTGAALTRAINENWKSDDNFKFTIERYVEARAFGQAHLRKWLQSRDGKRVGKLQGKTREGEYSDDMKIKLYRGVNSKTVASEVVDEYDRIKKTGTKENIKFREDCLIGFTTNKTVTKRFDRGLAYSRKVELHDVLFHKNLFSIIDEDEWVVRHPDEFVDMPVKNIYKFGYPWGYESKY